MSKLGQHGVARWGITILTGWLVVFGAQAQQTPSSTDTDNQGGFVVIEETQAPPPPRPLPISIPAQTVPLSGSTVPVPVASGASPSPYKPGSAVYEIPLVKPGASGAVVAETSATPLPKQSVNPGAAKVVREPVAVALLPTSVVSVPTVKALPPPPPKTWTLRQGYPIGQELKSWAKQVEPHWTVVWNMSSDVVAPSTTTFSGDFATAAQQVITDLAANGALIHYKTFDGNNTFVVFGPGATAQ